MKTHEKLSMRQMCDSSNENKGKSCSFLDAIRRCSCGRLADWLKLDGQVKPCQYARDWSVRYGALCRSSQLHFESLLSVLGSLKKATENDASCHGPVEKGRTDVGVYTCTHFTISLFCLSTTLSIYPIQCCLCPRSVQLSEMIVWESAL